jgi:Ca-activated chloride channel homolog
MSIELFGISWLSFSYWFYALIIGVILMSLLIWQQRKRISIINALVAQEWRSLLLPQFSLLKYIAKVVLLCIGIVALCLGLLRPAWGIVEQNIKQEGRDLLIALDVSRSMLAQDRSPNRLEFAKTKIKKLVQKLECDRVGLLIFSGSTIVQCPLTTDYSAFFMFLDQLDAETISSGTTAIDKAIKKALNLFAGMENKKNKLFAIFTDGEDFSSNLTDIKKEASQQGMIMFAIGLGTPEGAPIPLVNEKSEAIDHQRDEKGAIVISRLNEGILRAVADESGGIYLRAQDDDKDINVLIARVQQFEKEAFEDKKLSNIRERYPYFVAIAFICFMLEWLL